jgi:hypothetical protein
MNDFVRAAIVGTGQLSASEAEKTGSSADALVAELPDLGRERELLLRAGGYALLLRAARLPDAHTSSTEPAEPDTAALPSTRLNELIATLLAASSSSLLSEALRRMARAGLRLPEELLPIALSVTASDTRELLRPVLGKRGLWLAARRPAWAWALEPFGAQQALPADLQARWDDASAAERKVLLHAAFHANPERARQLIISSWKAAKADVRLAWLELLGKFLVAEDLPLLTQLPADRSVNVRLEVARLLWRFPNSELSVRLRERAEGLVSFSATANPAFKLRITLPPETFDASWEKEGIVEAAPATMGRRQWWLAQLLSAVSPDHWARRFGVEPEQFVSAARQHEFADALLDGLTTAAVRHDARAWFAPLWEAATDDSRVVVVGLTALPRRVLSPKLTPEEAEPRMLALFGTEQEAQLLAFPGPWSAAVARAFLAGLASYRAEWTTLFDHAALALPLELLPATIAAPVVPGDQPYAQAYLRAFEQFQATVQTRRIIAQEIPL